MKFTEHMLKYVIFTFPFLISASLFGTQLKIPTSDILEIWERSCIKRLNDGDIEKAQNVLKVMNWQCANKQHFALRDAQSFESAQADLEAARETHNRYAATGKKWICYDERFGSSTKNTFIETIGKLTFNILKDSGANEDVARVVVSQIVLETSWGKRIFGNNLFNLKGSYNGQSVDFTTHEQLKDGSWVKITDSFRRYPAVEDSIKDYLQVLKVKWPESYRALFSSDNNAVNGFISGLHAGQTGGYATDKAYKDKILSVNKQVEELLSGSSYLPTYLRCLGREEELRRIPRSNP